MPRNKYPEETVKKILEVSLKLFIEKGYEQTTVLDIVANLGGLTRGAFYHHFKSKEEVIEAIFNQMPEGRHPFIEAMDEKAENGLERVRLALKIGLKMNDDPIRRAASGLALSLMKNPRFLAMFLKGLQEDARLLVPAIEEGMADGSIKKSNASALASLFALLTNFWMMPAIFPASNEEMMAKGEMIDIIFNALGFHVIDEEIEQMYIGLLESFNWEQ